ncbi:hypothetical protein [uncultured Croceitalea sp.]|uniref:hypothetical protein n=1 Tax=uncultured Croceitalea sp. TaxID=1798908 RepID=UPI003305CAD1
MSVKNPKKFEKLSELKNVILAKKSETGDTITKVYKDKNHEVKKALRFKTDADRTKLT